MTATEWHLLTCFLAVVDVATFAVEVVGFRLVLKKVTEIVVVAAEAIDKAVKSSIDQARADAVEEFKTALGPALGLLSQGLPGLIKSALAGVRVSAGGHLVVKDTCTEDVDTGTPGVTCTPPDGGCT